MQKDLYEVVDLGEAQAVLTLGFHLSFLDQAESGPYKIFVFEADHPNEKNIIIEDVIQKFRNRNLRVDALSFYLSGKELKNRIFEDNDRRGIKKLAGV